MLYLDLQSTTKIIACIYLSVCIYTCIYVGIPSILARKAITLGTLGLEVGLSGRLRLLPQKLLSLGRSMRVLVGYIVYGIESIWYRTNCIEYMV